MREDNEMLSSVRLELAIFDCSAVTSQRSVNCWVMLCSPRVAGYVHSDNLPLANHRVDRRIAELESQQAFVSMTQQN